jgi:hypothetical protein
MKRQAPDNLAPIQPQAPRFDPPSPSETLKINVFMPYRSLGTSLE